MRKLRLYLDTSVISMIASPHVTVREAITKEFFRLVAERAEEFELVISPMVIEEIEKSSEPKRTIIGDFLSDLKPTILQKTDDVSFLVKKFFEKKVLGNRHYNDLTHIAYAVTARCDYIISWNFRHFVNYRTISRVREVTQEYNYSNVLIVSPETFVGEKFYEND